MTRKIETELNKLITTYAENKASLDDLDKLVKKDNNRIKEIMGDLNINEKSYGGYKATVSKSTRVTMDEAKLLEVVENGTYLNESSGFYNISLDNYPGLIRTTRYVDLDVLEDLIYHNLLSPEVLQKLGECKVEKEIVTLRIAKAKA